METDTSKSPLPVPDTKDRPASQWAKRAETAVEARALGKKLRKGKRILFHSRRHLAA